MGEGQGGGENTNDFNSCRPPPNPLPPGEGGGFPFRHYLTPDRKVNAPDEPNDPNDPNDPNELKR
jgi:hypothetical protein